MPDQFQFLGLGVTDWLAILTLAVLAFQTIIFAYQTKIAREQGRLASTQLELSEKVKLSAQPYFDAAVNRLKVNFKNEGRGASEGANIQYILKEKGTGTASLAVAKLQPLAPGSTGEIEVTSRDMQTLLQKYETLLLSWQGTRADGKPFDGSLPETELRHIATINRV